MANNRIKFKHFCGTLEKWNTKKSSGLWDESVVFGRIHTDGKWLYKIYAGAIDEHKDLYEYNFVTAEDFDKYEERLSALETELNKAEDPEIGKVVFTDEDFKEALRNTINLLFTKDEKDLEKRLEAVEDAVLWVTTEDID